jgi:dihydroorotate dehydrogenase electron transfer subunit
VVGVQLTIPALIDRNPLHAEFYADRACQLRTRIVENVRVAQDTYRVRFDAPEIARRIVPGQFLMMRLAGLNDPLLGRPLALYDVIRDSSGRPTSIDVVYATFGKMTHQLARCVPGDELDIWGPLGNGFPPTPTKHLIMVAGGIGQTPFLALGQEYMGTCQYGDPPRTVEQANRVTLCYGVRTAALLARAEDFRSAGFDLRIASNDGTIGHHGLVTDLLQQVLSETHEEDRAVVSCGPEPMMEAVAEICHRSNTRCIVSLETPMACGIGICFSCVAKVRQPDGSWDWKRTCVEGPIFDAQKIEW